MSQLIYPQMRQELIDHVKALSDPDYQKDFWVKKITTPDLKHDEFDYVVHFFYDDTKLAEAPESLIGWILKNQSEAISIKELTGAIENILRNYGTNLSDEEYISLHEWDNVIIAARKSLALLELNDQQTHPQNGIALF
jgi:hypothetical protein